MKIAVFVDEQKNVLPFYSNGVVEMYSDETGQWECVNEIPFDLRIQYDLRDLHLKIGMLTSEFDNCTLLVVKDIKGVPQSILQEKGIGIWKLNAVFFTEILNLIKAELNQVQAERARPKKVVKPVLVGNPKDLEYQIDLGAELKKDQSLNSVDIIIPFIKETNFKKLFILCDHLPKWFSIAMERFELKSYVEEDKQGVLHVIVSPAQNEQDISYRKYIHIPGMGGGCSSGGC